MSWVELESVLFETARSATGLAVNWLIQSTLLIAGGLAIGYVLRAGGSAVQSAVYRTTLVAVLVCPFASLALSVLGVSGWSLVMPSAYSVATSTVNVGIDATTNKTPFVETAAIDSGQVQNQSPLLPLSSPALDIQRSPTFSDARVGRDEA